MVRFPVLETSIAWRFALIITTILWAFSFSLFGEYYLAGHVDNYFAVLIRVGLAALVFCRFCVLAGTT